MEKTKSKKIGFGVVIAIVLILAAVWLLLVPKAIPQLWHQPAVLQGPHDYDNGVMIYPDFKAEHYRRFLQDYEDFPEYLKIERQYIRDICAKAATSDVNSRYYGEPNTGNFSFELQPDTITAGILLVHGLSDSPHHIRAVAEIFKEQGCYVIGLRLPGHGTIPAALMDVDRKDWIAAVEFGAAMVQRKLSRVEGNPKFYVGGFSTGGALTLRYTLNSISEKNSLINAEFRKPDKLFLFSPAIAVTRMAIAANWHKLVSWLPGFKKLKWRDLIVLEDDPCKYNSFPKNAADQIHLLAKANRKLVTNLKEANELSAMPPIFAFQSTVDATVKAEALVWLFSEIANAESKLFLFDINRSPDILEFVVSKKQALNHSSYELSELNFRYTFITNGENAEPQVIAYTWEPGSQFGESLSTATASVPLDDPWPIKVSCLSHVAIPISPEDSLYGQTSRYAQLPGDQYLLGENDMLNDRAELLRLRYNPFFTYIEEILRREAGGEEVAGEKL